MQFNEIVPGKSDTRQEVMQHCSDEVGIAGSCCGEET